ncbi:MAG: hypothetical protein AMXMBFR49_15290 [Chlorobiota bacterium]|nr:MAG: DUF2254 domain-containing protein [Chlorobiota bacterium]
MNQETTKPQKISVPWTKPLALLFVSALLIYLFGRMMDHLFVYFNFNPLAALYAEHVDSLTNTLGGLGEVVTGVLSIEITALAIIVQLAANKYSSKIFELFFENRINVIILFVYVITAIVTVLVVNTLNAEATALFAYSITQALVLVILSLVIVIPHFNYVFHFLRPDNFLMYVENEMRTVLENVVKSRRKGRKYIEGEKILVNEKINFIGDVAINSIMSGDRASTLLCINSLKNVLSHYIKIKDRLPDNWDNLSGSVLLDPDFSSFAPYVLKKIEKKKIFLETKVFKLYEMLFEHGRKSMRDVMSGILLNVELISYEAMKNEDDGTLQMAFQYMNTFLRIGIREKDPRTVFTALEHYRLIAEETLKYKPKLAEELSYYFKYYGHESVKNNVLFILETAAYDLCLLNEKAYDLQSPNLDKMLDIFLTVDQPIEDNEPKKDSKEETSLMGVRIAQIRLAGYYLLKGDETLARKIFEDIKVEPIVRIRKIRDIIMNTQNEEFWEITPRGINFYYMPQDRKDALKQFFEWFEV